MTRDNSQHFEDFTNVVEHEQNFIDKRGVAGRLFVVTSPLSYSATAFFVSPTILCTANHALVAGPKFVVVAQYAPSLEQARKDKAKIYEVEEISAGNVDP